MGVVVRRYIDILTIIINFPYNYTPLVYISSFFGSSIPTLLCSFCKCFFVLLNIGVGTILVYIREHVGWWRRPNCSDDINTVYMYSTYIAGTLKVGGHGSLPLVSTPV